MRVSIDTTQNVSIHYQIATIPERIGAYLLDIFIMSGYVLLVGSVLGFSNFFSDHYFGGNENFNALYLLFFLPVMCYSLLCETFFNGQSVGKMAARIRVMRLDGRNPTFGNYLLRWLFRIIEIDILYGIIAIIAIAINGKGQRLGDMVAGTFVVKISDGNVPQLSATINHSQGDSFTQPSAVSQLQFPEAGRLTENEAAIIRKALLLSDENKAELQQKLADKLKANLGITTEMDNEEFIKALLKDYDNHKL